MSRWLLPMLGLLGACTPEDAADYVLQLQPRVPANQDPFSTSPVVKLLITESGSTDVLDLGSLSSGSVEQEGLSDLVEATIGVVLEDEGGKPRQYDPDLLLAYGEAGPFNLSSGEETLEQEVLIAEYGEVGELDEFTDDAHFLAGAAVVPSGDVYVFGGCEGYSTNSSALNGIYKLTDLNQGDWKFERIGKMPTVEDDDSGKRCGHSVNLVEGDAEDSPYILVAGGRDDSDINTENTFSTGFLFDPATEEVIWEGFIGEKRATATPRSQHIAVEMSNGKTMLIGGFDGSGQLGIDSSFVIYDPAVGFTEPEDLNMSPVGIAAASAGTEGVLACGGAELLSGGTESDPLDTCFLISLTGESVDEVEPLPVALQGAAMAALPTGQVLVSGGFDSTCTNGQSQAEATTGTWLYSPDSDTWQAVGDMKYPRGLHKLITTADGSVMAVGGTEFGAVIFATGATEVTCPEVYDPTSLTWSEADNCADSAGGFFPTVTVSATGGFVLSGGWEGESSSAVQGGTAYGVIGGGPQSF